MARVLEPLSDDTIKRTTVGNLRKEYKKLSDFYLRIMNNELVYCSHCGQWKNASAFYSSTVSPDGIEHYACRECILNECTDYDKKTGVRTDNRDKTVNTFRRLDWYFNEKMYNDQIRSLSEQTNEHMRGTGAQQWIVMLKSLPNWKGLTFKDSEFELDDDVINGNTEEDIKVVQKTLKAAKKRFGSSYSNEDLMFLENEYEDWVTRYECNTKAQETIFERLAFKKWEINKATKAGQNTKDLDRTYTELLSSINILPRQNSSSGLADTLSFGQLIEKWEENEPVPDPDPEFADCDGIGKYIRVWFKGHLARALGLDNGYTREYDEYIKQYTVNKPEYEEDGTSETIYESLFGNDGD